MIPNAVVPPVEAPIERLKEHGLGRHDFFLFAGRISPEKGVHTLLEAITPLLGSKKLVIAGGSSFTDGYIEKVRALATDDVIFLGRVDRDYMHELLSNCYAYVLPSVMEGLSVGLLEALSYGLAIVTTAIPENLEVVGDVALTFPTGDVEALRSQFQRLLDEEALAPDLRRRTAERAAAWPDWDGVAERTEALYYQLLGRTPPNGDSTP